MRAEYDFDLGIVGGGAAGLSVAAGAARLGLSVLLCERERRLGGDCLHYGCVPSKTLIATARAYAAMASAERLGLPPVIRPPVDFSRVAARVAGVVARLQEHDSVERFARLGVTTRLGQAAFVDEHTVLCDGRRASARAWVVATGSRAAAPDIPGLAEAGFLTNRELFSLTALPESLVVLGGGAMACEMAQALARLGSRVTVVQRGGRLLSGQDPDVSGAVLAALSADGVDVRLGATVERVEVAAGRKVVRLVRAGLKEAVSGTHLLVALGRRPNIEGLGLDAAGVEVGPRGPVHDARLRTTQRHIYVAGDVTGAHLFTHAAAHEASVVVAGAVFRLPRRVDHRFLPRCVFTDPEAASLGLGEEEARAAGIETRVVVERFSDNDRAVAEGREAGFAKLVLGRRGRLLGVRLVGAGAGELVGAWSVFFGRPSGLFGLAGTVLPYPTLSEITTRAAGTVAGERLFSPLVRGALRLLFGYRGRSRPA